MTAVIARCCTLLFDRRQISSQAEPSHSSYPSLLAPLAQNRLCHCPRGLDSHPPGSQPLIDIRFLRHELRKRTVHYPPTVASAESSDLPRRFLWDGVSWSVAHWTIGPACIPSFVPRERPPTFTKLQHNTARGFRTASFLEATEKTLSLPLIHPILLRQNLGVGMRVPPHLTSISSSGTRLTILHNHKVTEKRAYILYAARHPIIHAAGK